MSSSPFTVTSTRNTPSSSKKSYFNNNGNDSNKNSPSTNAVTRKLSLTSQSSLTDPFVRKDAGTQKLLSDQENQRKAQDQVRQWFSDYGSCAKYLVKTQMLEAKRNAARTLRKEREAAAQQQQLLLQQRKQQQEQEEQEEKRQEQAAIIEAAGALSSSDNDSENDDEQQENDNDDEMMLMIGNRPISPAHDPASVLTFRDYCEDNATSSTVTNSPRESIAESIATTSSNRNSGSGNIIPAQPTFEYVNLDEEEETYYDNSSLVVLSPSTSFKNKKNQQQHHFPEEPPPTGEADHHHDGEELSSTDTTTTTTTDDDDDDDEGDDSSKTTNPHVHRHHNQRQDSTSHHHHHHHNHHNQKPQVDIYDKIKKLKKHRLLQARIQTSIFTLKSLIRVAKEHDLTNNFRAVAVATEEQEEEKRVVAVERKKEKLVEGWNTLIECLDEALEYEIVIPSVTTTTNDSSAVPSSKDSNTTENSNSNNNNNNDDEIDSPETGTTTTKLTDYEFPDFLTIIDIMQGLGLFFPDLAPPVHGRRPDGFIEVHRRLLRQSLEEAEDFLEAFDQVNLAEAGRIVDPNDDDELLRQRRIPTPTPLTSSYLFAAGSSSSTSIDNIDNNDENQQNLLLNGVAVDDNSNNNSIIKTHFITKTGSRPGSPVTAASPSWLSLNSPSEKSFLYLSRRKSQQDNDEADNEDDKTQQNQKQQHVDPLLQQQQNESSTITTPPSTSMNSTPTLTGMMMMMNNNTPLSTASAMSSATKSYLASQNSLDSDMFEKSLELFHNNKQAMMKYCEEKFPLADPTDMGPEFVRKSREVRQMLKLHRLSLEKQKFKQQQQKNSHK